jgi:hypothetical protein
MHIDNIAIFATMLEKSCNNIERQASFRKISHKSIKIKAAGHAKKFVCS